MCMRMVFSWGSHNTMQIPRRIEITVPPVLVWTTGADSLWKALQFGPVTSKIAEFRCICLPIRITITTYSNIIVTTNLLVLYTAHVHIRHRAPSTTWRIFLSSEASSFFFFLSSLPNDLWQDRLLKNLFRAARPSGQTPFDHPCLTLEQLFRLPQLRFRGG